MKHSSSPNQPPSEWRLIYQLSILEDTLLEKILLEELAKQMDLLGMSRDFFERVILSIRNSISKSFELFSVIEAGFQIKLFVYLPEKIMDRNPKSSWGFFKVEKAVPASSLKDSPLTHMIEFYLYLEG